MLRYCFVLLLAKSLPAIEKITKLVYHQKAEQCLK